MADEKGVSVKPLPQSEASVTDAEKKQKGNQYLGVDAWVTPDAWTRFLVREDCILYFDINRVLSGTNADAFYVPGKKSTEGTKRPQKNKRQAKFKSYWGKKILLPVKSNSGLTVKRGGKSYPRKFFTINVPSYLSMNAIGLWINTQFKNADRRPDHWVTETNTTWYINVDLKEKSKLKDSGSSAKGS